ncbi:MAG: hypothetical protein JWO30_974 [Fibrobacteres bacterium]|nr:hypothetical protein [Fibrobacterota bacterium]
MAGDRFEIASLDGALKVTRNGAVEFDSPWAGARLGKAMEWMEILNAGTLRGKPLHEAFRHGPYSLWQCWLHELYFPYFTSYAQFQGLFDWLESAGWPRLEIVSPLPGDLRKALTGAYLAGEGGAPGTLMAAAEAVARIGLPLAWRRSTLKRKNRVLIYTPDIVSDAVHGCDFRFSKVYAWLASRQVSGAEIFHLVDQRLALRNARARGRIPMYLELWDTHPRMEKGMELQADGLPRSLQSLVRRILPRFAANCNASARRIDGLKTMLRGSGLRLLLGMDDFRSNNELLIACREEGIRTVLVQHGLITRFNPGWVACGLPEETLIAPDRYLVRAPLWKSVLERYAPRLAKVAVVAGGLDGVVQAEEGPKGLSAPRDPREGIDVLLVAETLWDPREAAPFIQKLATDPRLRIHFKIRPDMDERKQIRPYFGDGRPHRVVLDLAGARGEIDIVLGSHSSLIYKLLEWQKPIFRLETPFEYGEQLDIFGLTDPLSLADEPYARFLGAMQRDGAVYAERWAAYRGADDLPDYTTILEAELMNAR